MADKKHALSISFLDAAHVVFSTLSSSGMQVPYKLHVAAATGC
jgi:hypothetical protein